MGSIEWKKCLYCDYWAFRPYLHDPHGHAECGWCWDYLDEGGLPNGQWWGTYQTTMQTKSDALINLNMLPQQIASLRDVVEHIVSYMVKPISEDNILEVDL